MTLPAIILRLQRQLVLQRLAMMPASRYQQLDLGFFDLPLLAFYPQDPVTVIQVKIDPAMGKGLLQEEDDMSGNQLVLHIRLEDFYNFHIHYYRSKEMLMEK